MNVVRLPVTIPDGWEASMFAGEWIRVVLTRPLREGEQPDILRVVLGVRDVSHALVIDDVSELRGACARLERWYCGCRVRR